MPELPDVDGLRRTVARGKHRTCPRCQAPLELTVAGDRTSHACSRCQKIGRRAA